MTETNRIVNDLSLEFFLNKDSYGKYLEKKIPERQEQYKKDKRFYRKRISDLTKQFLNNEFPENTLSNKDLLMAFDMYSRVCVEYFKVLDKNDILQEDYISLLEGTSEINNNPQLNVDNIQNIDEANNLLMRSIKIAEPNSLEKLVKRKSTKSIKKEHIPLQKDINLNDPVFKKKGIKAKNKDNIKNKEKNNITNIYDKENKKT